MIFGWKKDPAWTAHYEAVRERRMQAMRFRAQYELALAQEQISKNALRYSIADWATSAQKIT